MAESKETSEEEPKNLQELYQEVMKEIREIRPRTEDGDKEANEALDILEKRASELARKIAKQEGIQDPYENDPLLQKWESLWDKLREARNEGADESAIWEEINATAAALDARESFSKN